MIKFYWKKNENMFKLLLSCFNIFFHMCLNLFMSAESPEPVWQLEAHLDNLHDANTQPEAQGSSEL